MNKISASVRSNTVWAWVAACKERNHRVSDEKSCVPPLGEAAIRATGGRGLLQIVARVCFGVTRAETSGAFSE
ncbi:MAG: hypothetical protein K2K83_07005 [Rikenella sp.]|nr:hypothetical protein [Rikenella sp.]